MDFFNGLCGLLQHIAWTSDSGILKSDLQIIEQTGNTYKLEVNSVMEVLSNLEKQGVQVKNITQIHKTLEDVYNEFIQEASL